MFLACGDNRFHDIDQFSDSNRPFIRGMMINACNCGRPPVRANKGRNSEIFRSSPSSRADEHKRDGFARPSRILLTFRRRAKKKRVRGREEASDRYSFDREEPRLTTRLRKGKRVPSCGETIKIPYRGRQRPFFVPVARLCMSAHLHIPPRGHGAAARRAGLMHARL